MVRYFVVFGLLILTALHYAFVAYRIHQIQSEPAVYAWSNDSIVAEEGVKEFINGILDENTRHVDSFHTLSPHTFLVKQTPKATVLMCSDSRVHSDAFYDMPVNSLFIIRNIGNQMTTASGSVEYGIRYLNTPVLLIIGHSGCGAVKAAMTDFSTVSEPLQKELVTLDVNLYDSLEQNVIKNVNNQVALAIAKFSDLVQDKKLVVIGAVYDLHNDFRIGHGRLILTNFNGVVNPTRFD